MNGSVKDLTVTGRAHRAGEISQKSAATDAAMRCSAQRRTSTAHWSRQSIRQSDETLLTEMERRMGRAQRWRSRSRGDLGQASLAACGSLPLAESLAMGRVNFTRRASKQAKSSPASAEWSQ